MLLNHTEKSNSTRRFNTVDSFLGYDHEIICALSITSFRSLLCNFTVRKVVQNLLNHM
uniref:Uncharacterized protein n=1 Tax=Arundo donax TaxID=35708 RepID=A0A0A9ANA9_ARUDO